MKPVNIRKENNSLYGSQEEIRKILIELKKFNVEGGDDDSPYRDIFKDSLDGIQKVIIHILNDNDSWTKKGDYQ